MNIEHAKKRYAALMAEVDELSKDADLIHAKRRAIHTRASQLDREIKNQEASQ
jgi:hypothetical protein